MPTRLQRSRFETTNENAGAGALARAQPFWYLVIDAAKKVWQHESFDHVLRSEESIPTKVDYIIQNPVRAGLVRTATDYRWLWVGSKI